MGESGDGQGVIWRKIVAGAITLVVLAGGGYTLTQGDVADTGTGTGTATQSAQPANANDDRPLTFRTGKQLEEHYAKHGKTMGFKSARTYEQAAAAVVRNAKALHKTEKEDGDDVYYLVASDEIVFVSGAGYIRTYFNPGGKSYFDRQ